MSRAWGVIALVVAALDWMPAVLIPLAITLLLTFRLAARGRRRGAARARRPQLTVA